MEVLFFIFIKEVIVSQTFSLLSEEDSFSKKYVGPPLFQGGRMIKENGIKPG